MHQDDLAELPFARHIFCKGHQPLLIRVCGKTVQNDDLGGDFVHHAEDARFRRVLDQPAAERIRGLKADDEDRVVLLVLDLEANSKGVVLEARVLSAA